MLKLILAGASAIALASTAALADPAATAATDANETPQYAPAEIAPLTPADVTTREDSTKLAQNEFVFADANADGVIDEAEFTAYTAIVAGANDAPAELPKEAMPADKAFAALAKGDEKITELELTEARAASFDKADANKDSKLDPIEQQKFAALMTVKPAEGGDQ